eukprot:m.31648 g.31648  ORF g.31648 m.31648 type:complete len:77 (+) comp8334_c0_seq1:50-280(+)
MFSRKNRLNQLICPHYHAFCCCFDFESARVVCENLNLKIGAKSPDRIQFTFNTGLAQETLHVNVRATQAWIFPCFA